MQQVISTERSDETTPPDTEGPALRCALTFAGQAGAWIDELAALVQASPAAARLVDLAGEHLRGLARTPEFATSGRWARGIDARDWFGDVRPSAAYMAGCAVSHPWVFTAQVARWLMVRDDVLEHAEVIALTGHSQGIIAAVLIAEQADLSVPEDRFLQWLDWAAYEGLHMEQSWRRDGLTADPEASPMAAISRLPRERLAAAVAATNARLPEHRHMVLSLENTWDRSVVSGPPASLVSLRQLLDATAKTHSADRRTPDPLPAFTWEWLSVSVPFHSPHMGAGKEAMEADLPRRGWTCDAGRLSREVINPSTAESMLGSPDLTAELMRSLFLQPVRWQSTVTALTQLDGLTHLVDLGPGDGVARLSYGVLKGTGVATISASTDGGRAHLAAGTLPPASDWRPFAPTLVSLPGGKRAVDNAWTRATGTPPVFLPGMTPTTVETPIVAAAADAGFMAELAGGGQVTERHLRQRVDELAATMAPGGQVVFNALFLDPYLWRLHLGEQKLVQKLAAAGAPFSGVTISAGIPPVDEAVALLDELEAVGLWLNAFKPGTPAQIAQVLKIAGARPDRTLFMHVEGGHAGGHHGWQSLDHVLLATYPKIREHSNVVLCVGGGVGDEARSTALLTGQWSVAHGRPPMPVDAIFLGTATMACKEAATSPAVKRALARAAGTPGWVRAGQVAGEITSGKSGLDADIFYLETSAASCARLLDAVAGDPEAAAARHDEIAQALSRTAKPWFGNLEAMTWREVLTRLAERMAIGRDGAYEDGVWLDISWRQRFADALARAEARCADLDEGTFPSKLADIDLQQPAACIDALCAAWPAAETHRLHPLDARWFVDALCRRPGKPVPFVPVIDADVRRWYSSDSLWQSHDDRFTADQVLAIPGPIAVRGITRVDEPIGELLGRFAQHLVQTLDAPVSLVERSPRTFDVSAVVTRECTSAGWHVVVRDGAERWGDTLAGLPGPLVDALLARDGWVAGRLVPNPLVGLCAPVAGATLTVSEHGRRATWRCDDERVTLVLDGDSIRVCVCPRLAGASASWRLEAQLVGGAVVVDPDLTLPRFYADALFGGDLQPAPLFADAIETVTVDAEQAAAYARVTGRVDDRALPSDLVFSIAWRPMFAALSALPEGLLRLVHLSHGVEVGPAGLPAPGDSVTVSARLTKVEDAAKGRTIHAVATLDGGERATLRATFFVRGDFGRTAGLREGRPDTDRSNASVPTPGRTLATATDVAPLDPAVFARVGGDHNPIHVSPTLARFAGLGGPIVHGLWSAARATAFVVDEVADGDASRIASTDASFLNPVVPGASLELVAVRRAVDGGAQHVEVTLSADGTPAVQVRVVLRASRVAYVFPGQGIQRPGMGMDGLGRSRAARKVWETADRVTRDNLGFSLLRVVRENPVRIWLPDGPVRHPEGVLNLTQFTQVAMAVLAAAQVAELEEAGALVEDALFAGHSVGEYAALSGYSKVLPLESVVQLVWRRGLTMHSLVPRDAAGESGWRMGVIRPQYARLDAPEVDALVDQVRADTGAFVEIVNYNVRGRQYAATGRKDALAELERRLMARQTGKKTPWVEVPGIDVPFHSSALVPGVDAFRENLEEWLPETMAVHRLAHRYIPNLVARPFELTREFAASILEVADSAVVRDLLERWDAELERPDRLARTLLVELLAWQFASPVRWIETQDLLLNPTWAGGLGVDAIVEVGVGYQPTLSNMAKQTRLALGSSLPVYNLEADRDAVLFRDSDAAPEAPAPAPAPAAAPQADAAPAPVAAPVSRGPVAPPPDVTPDVSTALRWVLAVQAKRRLDQLDAGETLEEVFDGVSSRVNQVLLDLGAELGSGPVDGAAQLTLGDLATQLGARARYRGPGPYRTARHDAACTQVLGPAGWTKRSLEDHLADRYGFGPGLVAEALDVLVLDCRDGKSTRGGDLGALPGRVADATEAKALARSIAEILGERHGFALPGDGGGAAATAVDAEALNALRDELLGADGLLTRTAAVLGRTQTPEVPLPAPAAAASILDPEVERALQPAFDAGKHVVLDSGWAWAHRDVVALVSEGGDGERLVAWGGDTPVGRTAAWYAARADGPVAATLQRIAAGGERPAVSWTPVRPGPDGDRPDGTRASFVDALTPRDCGVLASDWRSVLAAGADTAWDFSGRTALVTGAGPGGIATAVVRHLLRGGARVIVTTSSYRRARIDQYRSLYANNAGPGAELHVVPFNQASMADVDALTAWCAAEDLLPDLLLPFAAVKDLGTLDTLGPRAEVVLRAMLLGPERLLGRLAATFRTQGRGDRLQVLVPLSPNLGTFGGDGMYGETKAGLETLAAKWSSEHNAWGRHTALVPVRIGWVRGTALMDGNDAAAWHLEERTGARTWSSDEMGFMLAALCVGEVRAAAAQAPLQVDLTAGLGDVADLSGTMDAIRADLQAPATDTVGPVVHALPSWEPVTVSTTAPVRDGGVSLDRMVVICGFGEVGPWGSSRTRWAREVDPHLPPAAVLELAWTTGLVQFEAGQWVDVESGDPVPEHAIGDRYREAVTQRSGVRIAEPETVGYDPDDVPVLATAWLDRDFTFNVASADEARAFQQADPEHTRVHCADGQWSVTRTAGTQVRVPRRSTLSRRVIGQVPNGWDPTRFGVPDEMAERVDKAALFNLVSTVEAFLSAGLTPEELLQKVHPSRVGSTQGSGIGGADSLRRLYVDPVLDTDRQRDILQETLINVVASYAVQSYVGGYGPVSSPVAACATAAVSVEHGVEKILLGKADVVVAGGVDDISMSGATGFADMGATADSIVMAAKGLEPDEMSRSNDLRRGGFVESHGGGAALLVRGDVALRLGLPVFGVVAYAGTYTDGIHPSVPAPGLGALGCAVGGVHSPLGRALADHGLTADDVTVVSKHDTSTGANDPNEAELHQRIQGAIGRTPGNPLFVVSQKTLTGHAKGGAAAWQLHGLCQVIGTGQVPGNRNLHCVDPALQGHDHLLYTDRTLTLPHGARAGVLTSLGFGHVGAIVCIAHPDVWLEKVPLADRQAWATAAEDRLERSRRDHFGALLGEHALYTKPADRRLPDGVNEADLLLDPGTRLGADGRFARP